MIRIRASSAAGDVLQDLRVAMEKTHVLGVAEITLLGGVLERQPIPLRGAVAGQQNKWGRIRRLRAEREIEQDEREMGRTAG